VKRIAPLALSALLADCQIMDDAIRARGKGTVLVYRAPADLV